VTTCWNRGCHHLNFERSDQAAPFLEAALRLLTCCPELQHRKVPCPWKAIDDSSTTSERSDCTVKDASLLVRAGLNASAAQLTRVQCTGEPETFDPTMHRTQCAHRFLAALSIIELSS